LGFDDERSTHTVAYKKASDHARATRIARVLTRPTGATQTIETGMKTNKE
jgi:hypothetical protein